MSETQQPLFSTVYITKIILLIILYVITGKLGLLLAVPPGYATVIWPPSGISIGMLIVHGWRLWPGIFLGSFILNSHVSGAITLADGIFFDKILIAAGIAIGSTLQALLGYILVKRVLGLPLAFKNVRDMLVLFVLTGPISCLIAATVGVVTLYLADMVMVTTLLINWKTWWMGDMFGVVVFLPLILIAPWSPNKLTWRGQVIGRLPLMAMLTLLLPLGITFYAWKITSEMVYKQGFFEFENLVLESEKSLLHRLQTYDQLLLGAVGFFQGSDNVSREEWYTYVSALDIPTRFPGMNGMGYIVDVKPDHLETYLKDVRKDNAANFIIHPQNHTNLFFIVTYIEPLENNRPALGYNIASEPNRLEAAIRARDQGEAVITKNVLLQQNENKDLGFLLLRPMYHRGQSTRTVEERRAAFWGWIYAPIVSKKFMQTLTKSQDKTLDISVYDGAVESEDYLIYSSKEQEEQLNSSPVFTIRKKLEVMHQSWLIVWTSTTAFEQLKYNNEPFLVMTSGLLFTGLFIIILIILVHRSEMVQRLVDLKTQEIKANEEQMRLLIQHTPAAVAMFDRNMRYIMTSERWLQDYKLVGSNIIGKSHYDIFPFNQNTPDWIHIYQRAMKGESISKEEDFWGHDEGKKEWVKWAIHPWRDAVGDIGGIVMFTEDITERKEVDRLKNEFISTVSHELRTPLTSIRGSLGLISGSMADKLPGNVNNLIDIAYKNCERLILLINDILDIDKIASGQMAFDMKLENLTALVDQAINVNRAYGEKYKVTFTSRSEDSSIMVNVDAARFIQVLSNLLSNAAKFSPEGGNVMVRVLNEQGMARVLVEDFGPGIPEKFQSHIFSKFSQADSSSSRKNDGTGLGLYISKQLIEHMDGEIGFDTKIGEGTTFWITLPKELK